MVQSAQARAAEGAATKAKRGSYSPKQKKNKPGTKGRKMDNPILSKYPTVSVLCALCVLCADVVCSMCTRFGEVFIMANMTLLSRRGLDNGTLRQDQTTDRIRALEQVSVCLVLLCCVCVCVCVCVFCVPCADAVCCVCCTGRQVLCGRAGGRSP